MSKRADVDRRLRDWQRTHGGLLTRAQAMALGATAKQIKVRLARAEWEIVFRTVYRDAGSPPTTHQHLLAACLAAGPHAMASHRSAAWLWEMVEAPPRAPELTVPSSDQHGRRVAGITVHRTTQRARTVLRRGIPATNSVRTLVDLGAVVGAGALTVAVDRALAARLVTVAGLVAELSRIGRRGRPGVAPLRQVLTDRGLVGAPHPSVLESQTLRLFRVWQLPVPVEQAAGADGEYRLDFAYADVRMAVEVDGYVWHFSPEQQRRDHARRNRLQAEGWRILVYTWRDVVNEPARVASEIASLYAALTASRPGGRGVAGSSPPGRTREPARGSPAAGQAPPSW